MIIEIKLQRNVKPFEFIGATAQDVADWIGDAANEIEHIALNGVVVYQAKDHKDG